MKLDNVSNQIYIVAINEARLNNHEYITPEHFLYATLMFSVGKNIIISSGGNIESIKNDLKNYFNTHIPKTKAENPIESFEFIRMFEIAFEEAKKAGKDTISINDIFMAFGMLKESHLVYILNKNEVKSHNLSISTHDKLNSYKEHICQDTNPNLELINRYTNNMVEESKNSDIIIGREDVISHTIQVLCRRAKSNIVHVGEAGVGKTAIVGGLAQLIQKGSVPKQLQGANIFCLNIYSVLAGTKYRGDFEERLIKILEEIAKVHKPIVYIDEVHTVVGHNPFLGNINITEILKPYLLKGEIKFIGSTTFDKYKKYFDKDKAFSRRFQRVDIEEATLDESIGILEGIKDKYEKYHNVKYTNHIIKYICELSSKHIKHRFLPDKAIDVMDEVGAYARINNKKENEVLINKKHIEFIVSNIAKVPKESLTATEADLLKKLKPNIMSQIFGQDEAIENVLSAIKLARAGLKEEYKPVASFLFVGPTGVGKTEVARQLAQNLNIKLIRFDMSEYQEKHSVSRLIGSPPGYVGYEEGGLLTDYITKDPNCVLLLDEIEKAHKDIINILLQVMDYGTLTDTTGKKIDFSNTIIIMTSNVGAKNIGKRVIGFDEKTIPNSEVQKEVEKYFSKEFRSRLDSVIVFNEIDTKMANLIAEKAIENLAKKLKAKNIKLKTTKGLINYISSKGLYKTFGAREIIRAVDTEIKPILVEEILFGDLTNGGEVLISFRQNKIKVSFK